MVFNDLRNELLQIFSMQMLILSWLWTLFGSKPRMMLPTSSIEKITLLLLLIKEDCFTNNKLKSLAFLWSQSQTHYHGKQVE